MATFRIQELITEAKKAGKKVTQTGLAQAAGISQASVWSIVEGRTKSPNPQILLAFADTFTKALGRKITIDDLIETNGRKAASEKRAKEIVVKEKPLEYLNQDDYISVPELGDIPCGDLDLVEEDNIVEDHMVPKSWARHGQFFLRAKGDSMSPIIVNGDLLLIEPGNWWSHKDVVIAYVDGEITCKYLYLLENQGMLVAENRKYDPIIVSPEMHIIGRVIKLMKEFVRGWRP